MFVQSRIFVFPSGDTALELSMLAESTTLSPGGRGRKAADQPPLTPSLSCR